MRKISLGKILAEIFYFIESCWWILILAGIVIYKLSKI